MSSRSIVLAGLGVLAVATAGCGSAEKARREAEMAALVKQVEELRKGQEQTSKEVSRLAGELKALDAEGVFLVGEAKTSAQEREQLKGAFQQQDEALRSQRTALDETNQKVAALSVPPPAAPPAEAAARPCAKPIRGCPPSACPRRPRPRRSRRRRREATTSRPRSCTPRRWQAFAQKSTVRR